MMRRQNITIALAAGLSLACLGLALRNQFVPKSEIERQAVENCTAIAKGMGLRDATRQCHIAAADNRNLIP